MPNEKKSAYSAISPARSAARGSSIIVPIEISSSRAGSSSSSAMTSSTSARMRRSSSAKATSGIMISTWAASPRPARASAPRTIARTCIA